MSGAYPLPIAHGAPLDSPNPQSSVIDRVDEIRAGDPEVDDDFAADTDFWTTSYDGTTAGYYKAGAYHISIDTDNLVAWETGDLTAGDFVAEVEVSHYDGPLINEGGLLFRYVDSANFYLFSVSSDGYFVVKKLVDGEWVTLVEWTESDAANTGSRSANYLTVLAEGEQLAFFINDELVAEVADDSFSEGAVALVAGTLDEYEVDIAFDNFALWSLDAASGPITGLPGRRTPDLPAQRSQDDQSLTVEERIEAIRSDEPAFYEDFSVDSGEWDSESSDETFYDFADDVFYINVLPVDWVSYSQTDYVYSDFLAEADTYHSFGPTAVEYGLYFRNTDGDNYYYFGISANGHFNFWKRIDAEWIEILPWAPSDALETGEGAYNRMGVLANGAQLTLLANDVVLAEVEDDSIAAGALGVFVRTYEEEDVEIAFDNVEVWDISTPEGAEPAQPAAVDQPSVAEIEGRFFDILMTEPAISDDFRVDTGDWSVNSSDDVTIEFLRRSLHISVDSADWITWSLYPTDLTDFLAEADVQVITSPLDGNYGIVFRFLDSDNFYVFRISPRGTFSLMKKVDGEWTTLTNWTASVAIDTSEGAINRISVLAEGPQLAVLINDEVVAQATDADIAEGQVGLAAGVYAEPGLEVAFDNVEIWDLTQ
ncbi:MAG: hypothetical protein QM346_07235 [Chloroflexota bacterium]|nr:hypothetical protein [Chloroflexota bacterium]